MLNPSIFREYDIRGIAGKDLDAGFARELGRAYVEYAEKRLGKTGLTISVGRDCRVTGEEYSGAMMEGMISAGAKVISLGMVTTPMTYFSLYNYEVDGAVMVTGSHNPANYNGFKMCVGKATLHGHDIQELLKIMQKGTAPKAGASGKPEARDIFQKYIDFVVGNVKVGKKLKVVVDAGNGAGSTYAPEVYKKLGCEVIELFCTPDGTFPNHPADPTVESNLQDIIKAVKEHKADCGIAFDGDADRIGVVNEKGEILWGDELMIVLSRAVLKDHPGATI
ncbi:MAG: phosphomannomutase/phosphoglucomutase, partial [Proteobacteria bacterium]